MRREGDLEPHVEAGLVGDAGRGGPPAGVPGRVTTAAAVAAFVKSRVAKGLRPKTVAWYGEMLMPLVRRYELLPETAEEIEEVLAQLGGVSPETRHDHFAAMGIFYRWAARRLDVVDATEKVERPRRVKRPKPALTEAQVVRVMGECRGPVEKALMALLLDTGMRIGEAHSVTWRTVGGAPGRYYCRVSGKTGEREVPMSDWTRWALAGVELPWSGRRGALSVAGLQRTVTRVLRRAGVMSGGAHLLRHTFARLYLRGGGDVFTLQRILGHARLSTTQVYAEPGRDDVMEAHGRFSPIVRLLGEAAGEREASGWQK